MRQLKYEGRAATWGIFYIQAAVVQRGDLGGDGEAKAEVRLALPGGIGAVEALKNLRLLLVGDAGAIVADGKAEPGIGDIQRKPDASTGWRIGKGVVDQDGEQLPDTLAVAEAGRKQLRRERDIPLQMMCGGL